MAWSYIRQSNIFGLLEKINDDAVSIYGSPNYLSTVLGGDISNSSKAWLFDGDRVTWIKQESTQQIHGTERT